MLPENATEKSFLFSLFRPAQVEAEVCCCLVNLSVMSPTDTKTTGPWLRALCRPQALAGITPQCFHYIVFTDAAICSKRSCLPPNNSNDKTTEQSHTQLSPRSRIVLSFVDFNQPVPRHSVRETIIVPATKMRKTGDRDIGADPEITQLGSASF